MNSADLKRFLGDCELSQVALAKLLGITPRAISLWLVDERAIPGPAESYMRLFRASPPHIRQYELARLNNRGTTMRDGMYGISFTGPADSGMGVLVFDCGRIYGADTGARYDGTYVFREETGKAEVLLKVTFPPNVHSVFGITNPYEWSIDVSTAIDPKLDRGKLQVKTSLGRNISAEFAYLRPLPEAA